MTQDRLNMLIAKAIIEGKSSLTADEKALLQHHADRWMRSGDRVKRAAGRVDPAITTLPDFVGEIVDISDDGAMATVKLDDPITLSGPDGLTGQTGEISVPIGGIEREIVPPEAPAAPSA